MPDSKVLIITYVFPPAAWVGSHRTLKYCKYLGQHGWTPIVVTALPIGVSFTDDNLTRQVPPSVGVHRTWDVDPAKVESKLAQRKLRKLVAAADAAPAGHSVAAPTPGRTGLLARAKHLIKAVLKDSPDSHIFWVPFAFIRGVSVMLREKVDVIYCTTPPHSSHIAAYLLAKCFGKPYVLDFRDPWYVTGSVREPIGKIPLLLNLETRIKRGIVRGAAKVICVSEGERDEMRAEFPDVAADKFTYITNGYDPTDLPWLEETPRDPARLRLVHAGTIYPGIAGEFLDAMWWLLENEPATAKSIELHLLGEIELEYDGIVRRLAAEGIAKVHGLRPHAEALRIVQASDVLVILMGGTKYLPSHLPAKSFEYLYVGKPVLAIAQEGELTQMLQRSGLGILLPTRSPEQVVAKLRALVREHAGGPVTRVPDRTYIRRFERAALAEQLAAVLDEVKEGGRVRHQYSAR